MDYVGKGTVKWTHQRRQSTQMFPLHLYLTYDVFSLSCCFSLSLSLPVGLFMVGGAEWSPAVGEVLRQLWRVTM